MAGVAYLAAFEICGLMLVQALSRGRGLLIRIWLGLVVGLMEMMWLPSLYAFIFTFDVAAHVLALVTALLGGLAALIISYKRNKNVKLHASKRPPVWLMTALLVPLIALTGVLQYNHTFREIDGSLYSGQSTYGDLCMHASFITGLVGQKFPPEYTLLPGTRLGYPFLVDALSSSMYLFGTPLNLSIIIPGTLMCALIYLGFMLFSYEITRSSAASALSLLLMVFSGGLGFIYYLGAGGAFEGSALSYGGNVISSLREALFSYYKAPANNPDFNLRWVNALCDLLIPQRTLMAGWLCAIPALYLLYTAMKTNARRDFILLGCFAGAMPMIHTHSFLGLGVISLGALIDRLIRSRSIEEAKTNLNFVLYGVIAVILALPQLLIWTFPQTINGGSLRILFDWINNNENGTFKDVWPWFWLKNVGPMFVITPIAAIFNKNKRVKALALGSLMLFALSEFVIFQPNVYDNNKLMWVAYLCMLPVGAGGIVRLLKRHGTPALKAVAATVLVLVMTLSGRVSVARELISGTPEYNYQLFYSSHVEAAEFIKQNTLQDSVFLTDDNHNNAVATLTGRKIVCGSSLYLYFHGVDYQTQQADAQYMLLHPTQTQDLYEKYGVDYVYISSYEISKGASVQAFDEAFTLIYESGDQYPYDKVRIYAVSERALVKFETDSDNTLQ